MNTAPVILGLAGQAATGKTVTAEGLAPIGRVIDLLTCSCGHEKSDHLALHGQDEIWDRLSICNRCKGGCPGFNLGGQVLWNHLFFALPIYRVASARQKIKGDKAHERTLFEIHEALLDLFGRNPLFSVISYYDDFVDLVKHVAGMYCEPEGTKARSFMQNFGLLCREYDEDVFVKWVLRKVAEEHRTFQSEFPTDGYPNLRFGSVISDVRFPNEARLIKEQSNGILIKLTGDPEVLRNRLIDRDGQALTDEQAAHPSENSISLIPESDFDAVLDTSLLTVQDQVEAVKTIVDKIVNSYAKA